MKHLKLTYSPEERIGPVSVLVTKSMETNMAGQKRSMGIVDLLKVHSNLKYKNGDRALN